MWRIQPRSLVIVCNRNEKFCLIPVQAGSRLIRQTDGAATMAISDQVLAEDVFVHDVARVRSVDGLTRIHCGFDSFNVHSGLRYVFRWHEAKARALERALGFWICLGNGALAPLIRPRFACCRRYHQ